MQPIIINPLFNKSRGEFPQVSFLVEGDENYAIISDGWDVCLVEVVPDQKSLGEYQPKEAFNYITVGVDECRTVAGLQAIVDSLRTTSAYDLLTRHFNMLYETYYVNRSREYVADIVEDEVFEPIDLNGGSNERDY